MTLRYAAALCAITGLALCGCGQNSAPQPAAVPAAGSQTADTFPVPKWDMTDTRGLIADDKSIVKIGDTGEVFNSHFPRPASLARALTGNDIPMDVPQDTHWSVAGYEYDNASRGVGAILYDNRVAVEMRQLENVQDQDVKDEVARYTDQFDINPTTVFGTRVSYWFWDDTHVRVMICAFKTDQKAFNMTTAAGDDDVADKLGISADAAETSKDTVEHLFGNSGDSTATQ